MSNYHRAPRALPSMIPTSLARPARHIRPGLTICLSRLARWACCSTRSGSRMAMSPRRSPVEWGFVGSIKRAGRGPQQPRGATPDGNLVGGPGERAKTAAGESIAIQLPPRAPYGDSLALQKQRQNEALSAPGSIGGTQPLSCGNLWFLAIARLIRLLADNNAFNGGLPHMVSRCRLLIACLGRASGEKKQHRNTHVPCHTSSQRGTGRPQLSPATPSGSQRREF